MLHTVASSKRELDTIQGSFPGRLVQPRLRNVWHFSRTHRNWNHLTGNATTTRATFCFVVFLAANFIGFPFHYKSFQEKKNDTSPLGYPRVFLAFFTTLPRLWGVTGVTLISPEVDTSMLFAHPMVAKTHFPDREFLESEFAASVRRKYRFGVKKGQTNSWNLAQQHQTLLENWSKSHINRIWQHLCHHVFPNASFNVVLEINLNATTAPDPTSVAPGRSTSNGSHLRSVSTLQIWKFTFSRFFNAF